MCTRNSEPGIVERRRVADREIGIRDSGPGTRGEGIRTPKREAGLSLISWLIVIVIAGLIVFAAFRVVPAYIESARLGSALASIRQDARTKSVGALRTKLSNQLMIDSLGDVNLDNFKFTRNGNQLTISIDQPIQKSWIGNLGFVIHSRHSITVTRGDGD
ncbi:MAG: DUF4845 domain-containing protein [Gammaproteobacteria bacterium]